MNATAERVAPVRRSARDALLSLWLLVPPVLSLLLASARTAEWYPTAARGDTIGSGTALAVQLIAACGLAAAGLLVAGMNAAFTCGVAPPRGSLRTLVRWGAAFTTLLPCAVGLLLPGEDPYDGGGFPGAAFLGAALWFIIAAPLFAIPALFAARRGILRQ